MVARSWDANAANNSVTAGETAQLYDTMTEHYKAIRDYSTDSLVAILRDLQKKTSHNRWDVGRMAAIKAALKSRGIILS